MRYLQRAGRRSLPGRQARLATAAILMATALAACGGGDGDGGGGAEAASGAKAPATIPELTDDPLTLSFIWFEWPPAQALEDFANAEYTKERPNVTIKVNTVPNANWHDAMFTQFAARQDRLRHPDPGLPAHRRGGDQRQHPRPHRLRQGEHRRRRLRPVPAGGLRPVPAGRDRASATRTRASTACRCSATRGR